MRLKTGILNTLKCKSGASILFVLGIMMLLLALSSSALTAASSNRGSNLRQNQYNSAVVLTDSIHRNIKYSLGLEPADAGFSNSLASELAWAIYDGYIVTDTEFELELDGAVADAIESEYNSEYNINLIFEFVSPIREKPPIDGTPMPGDDEEDEPPQPGIANVNATMIVEVVVEIQAMSYREKARLITTHAKYELTVCEWTDEATPGTMDLTIADWELVNYEITESEKEEDD